MKRRKFFGTTMAAGLSGAIGAEAAPPAPRGEVKSTAFTTLPEFIAGMTLQELRDDCHDRLFNQFLPFWDKGGYDLKYGGFMCLLNDDGTVQDDEKYIWYQGRAVWVYSFLYNNFGHDERWLDIARKTRDFMVNFMRAGKGRWYERVERDGRIKEGVNPNIYGAMFAAHGLAEFYKAARNPEDLELALETFHAAVKAYDDPGYTGSQVWANAISPDVFPKRGARDQGHSMVIINMLTDLLGHYSDSALEKIAVEHVDLVLNTFWNPDYGITNEYLRHDYSRIPGYEGHMFVGHCIETLWMIMFHSIRVRNGTIFYICKSRIRRFLEMAWDYVYGGCADENFYVLDIPGHRFGPSYDVKTMWAECEILIACMTVLEYTGDIWAKEWYERAREFTYRTIADTGIGVWRQAVNRYGENLVREGVSPYRKGNFHQPRSMMLNLLALERMIKNNGKLTPFPL
jgi:mannose/cellobiose epimerase-like protein (N-acyl-D-glucosamine 2-epimerase family)